MVESLSKFATPMGAIGLFIGGILVWYTVLAMRQGQLSLFVRHGTVIKTGSSARIYSLFFLIAAVLITIASFLLLFRAFFDISSELMIVLIIIGLLFFVVINAIGLITSK